MNTDRQMKYQGVASQYDRRYQYYDYGSLERCLLKFIPDTLSGLILEVGCGTGHWLEVIAKQGHQVTGLDLSIAMLYVARQKL